MTRRARRASISLLMALFALATSASAPAADRGERPFPRGFLWGTAIAGFQAEAGGPAVNADPHSDWWQWVRDPSNIAAGRVSGDLPENGPGHWQAYRRDIALARRRLHTGALRFSIEWSRIFPRSTAAVTLGRRPTIAQLRGLDALADQGAVRHYRAVLGELRRRQMAAFVTVSHFSLPTWIHDPIMVRDTLAGVAPDADLPAIPAPAGWLDDASVAEFAKYAAYLGWRFGDLVDTWAPINEPVVVTSSGYVNVPGVLAGNFPPGVFSYTAAAKVLNNLVLANAAAYDALKATDRGDADGDRRRARVGVVHNMVSFTPADPRSTLDVAGTRDADRLFNRLFLDAVVRGQVDADADGRIAPSERIARLRAKADFIGVNYYLRARVTGLGAPLSTRIRLLTFAPRLSYRTPHSPDAPPCPTRCSDLGWEIHVPGLRGALKAAGAYGLPVYITENGIADADDDQRSAFLVAHLTQLRRAMADGLADVRGYFHWALTDNLEWSSGYAPKFGLYAYDPTTLARTERVSASVFACIARANQVPPDLARRCAR